MAMRDGWNAGLVCLAMLGSVAAPGCGGDQAKTGTQVQVTDQMQKEAEASANYMESQTKKPASSKK